MYARTTTIQGDPASIDAGIAHVRDEVMPALAGIDGYRGISMLVDRESGRCVVTTSWESEEALNASADKVLSVRARAQEIVGAPTSDVESWEVAVMHRTHPTHEGACVRVSWLQLDPSTVDAALDVYRHTAIPGMEQLEGFSSASLLMDRATGRAVTTTTYDSREALERTREQAQAVRSTSSEEAGARVTDVHEFDLVLAHLHVPELV